jgi:hypothetical protein
VIFFIYHIYEKPSILLTRQILISKCSYNGVKNMAEPYYKNSDRGGGIALA